MIEDARSSMVNTQCPKCGNKVSTPLFSQSGFTVKDLFLISGGLDELI
jgi:ribosomal protein S27E